MIKKKKHDKRFFNSAIRAIHMGGPGLKINMVTFIVAGSTILIILNRSLLLVRRYHNHHQVAFSLDH